MTLGASFLVFTLTLAGVVSYVIHRYFATAGKALALAAFVAWLLYAGAVGILGPYTRPPGIVFYIVPLIVWVVVLARTRVGVRVFCAVPLAMLTGLQVFRLFVELYMNELWHAGLLPRMMTFHGANFDVLVGLSAPFIATLAARHAIPWKALAAWNIVGLATLANVVVRGILTAPGPLQLLQDDHPNLAIGLFPYTYIPGLMVMLAVTLHVTSLRALLRNESLDIDRAARFETR